MTICGTDRYQSPEQEMEADYGVLTDIFSLGIIFLEVLYSTVENNEIVNANTRNGSIPKSFSLSFHSEGKLIKAMLSHNPNDRPNSDSVTNQLNDLWYTKDKNDLQHVFERALSSAKNEYTRQMTMMLGEKSFMAPNALQEYHKEYLEKVLQKHCNQFDNETAKECQSVLNNDLNQILLKLDIENNERMAETMERFENEVKTSLRRYKQELTTFEPKIEPTEDFVIRIGEAEDKVRRLFLAEFENEPDHIIREFIGRLNSGLTEQRTIAIKAFGQRHKENKDANLLLKELNISNSMQQTQIPDYIVNLYSDFTVFREYDGSDSFRGRYYWTSFKIDGDERDHPIYLKGIGFAGRPSQPKERITMKVKVIQGAVSKPNATPLCEMEITYNVEANKITMINLNKSVRIVPNKQYAVHVWSVAGGMAQWKNPKRDMVLYNITKKKQIKLTVIELYNSVYSLKYSTHK